LRLAAESAKNSRLSALVGINLVVCPVVEGQAESAEQAQNDKHFGNIERSHEVSPLIRIIALVEIKIKYF
jgi:hypothetical protein